MLMCRQLVAARTPDRRAARARAPSRPKSAIPGSGPVGAATVAVEARRPACGLGACRPLALDRLKKFTRPRSSKATLDCGQMAMRAYP